MLTKEQFHQELEKRSQLNLRVRINQNTSTYLSVKSVKGHTIASIHEIFLQSSQEVLDALALYLQGKKSKESRKLIRRHIQETDFRKEGFLEPSNLEGCFYHLGHLYSEIKHMYFDCDLDLKLTWFSPRKSRFRRHFVKSRSMTFGEYRQALGLIRINRILDQKTVPKFFIAFVIYHEILHHLYPPYVDEKGICRYHGKEFKRQERKFLQYDAVTAWKREKMRDLFT